MTPFPRGEKRGTFMICKLNRILALCVALLLALPLLLWGDMERPMIYLADMVIFGIGYLLYYWLFNRGYLREVTGYVLKR